MSVVLRVERCLAIEDCLLSTGPVDPAESGGQGIFGLEPVWAARSGLADCPTNFVLVAI